MAEFSLKGSDEPGQSRSPSAGAGDRSGGRGEVNGVHVAQRYDLDLLVLQEVLQAAPAHAADSDAGVVQFAVGRTWLSPMLGGAARYAR